MLSFPVGWGEVNVAPDGTIYLLYFDTYEVHRSTNGGESWELMGLLPLDPETEEWGYIYPSPVADMIFLGAMDAPFIPDAKGIYKSTDGGATWKRVLEGGNITKVAFSPNFAQDGIAFASLSEYHVSLGVWKTEDWGETWFPVNNGLYTGGDFWGHQWVAVSPQFPKDQTVFTSDATGLYKTTNGGKSWIKISAPKALQVVFSPDYINDKTLLTAQYNLGLHLSQDGGQTWQAIFDEGVETEMAGIRHVLPFGSGSLPSLSDGESNPPALEFWVVSQEEYFGDAYLYRSRDYGISWEPISIYSQLAVTLNVESRFVQSGGHLTYTLHLTNTGTVILHTTLTDTLSAHIVSGVTGSGSTMLPGGRLTWQPTLTVPSGVWTGTIGVTIEEGYTGPITNVVTVSSAEGVTGTYTHTATIYKSWVHLPLIYR